MMSNRAQATRNALLIVATLVLFLLALVSMFGGNIFFYISVISFGIAWSIKILNRN